MQKRKAIVMKAIDNVATAVQEIQPGTEVTVDVAGQQVTVLVQDKIPFGHKFAIRDIQPDEKIMKYGAPIGAATELIKAGKHTHVHNMVGLRGRGDLVAKQ